MPNSTSGCLSIAACISGDGHRTKVATVGNSDTRGPTRTKVSSSADFSQV